MKFPMHILAVRTLPMTFCGALLAACGGGGGSSPTDSTMNATAASITSSNIYAGRGTLSKDPAATNPVINPVTSNPSANAITKIRFENINSTTAQVNVPVTFGHVFAVGHVAKGATLIGRLENGQTLPLQVDVKATHADGSIRHAIISAILPSVGAGQTSAMELVSSNTAGVSAGVTTSQFLASGFTASVNATIGGTRYQASADEVLKTGKATSWLAGATVNEWQVTAPLKTATGAIHPHLSARFAIRYYSATKKTRVDVIVENNWAYEPNPQNFNYDVQVLVSGQPVFTQTSLTHMHHARWRKLFWVGGSEPQINVKHDPSYLIASRALPNYDTSLDIKETTLAALSTRWSKANIAPMGNGMAMAAMPTTGGRGDIGLLPAWNATYLLTMDRRARDAALGTANLAGSWSAHYRDKNTDQPISLIDYPYMTIAGRPNDTKNPATGKFESFPACAANADCKSPLIHDVSHQPAFAYLPYMVTGDHYYLEELQFYGMYNVFNSNPGYRENIKGLLKPEQVRGQAWSLRTLAEAAYITPDADRLKSHFMRILDSNLDWYNAEYSNNANTNKLGIITNGYSLVYSNGTGIGPWQDDFFTSAVGHASELGFTKASALLKWKAKFPVSRMIGVDACYINAAMYTMIVRDDSNSQIYSSIGQAFKVSDKSQNLFLSQGCATAAQANSLKLKVGEMTGYSSGTEGYPSNMQPALAMSTDVSGADGTKAWKVFQSRSVKPDYSTSPQFAIVPR